MGIDRSRRYTFEEVADLYNEVRPGYPEELVCDVLSHAAIPLDGRILEIGCGPGNATEMFARSGREVVALELGKRLASHAVSRCAGYPRVTIINTSFEEWVLEEGAFDLVISADAFHWIPPEIGYRKVAQALKHSGSAAFFWNVPVNPYSDWSRSIDELYRRRFPHVENPERSFDLPWLVGVIKQSFRDSGSFGEVTVRQYATTDRLTAGQYVKLLRTYSGHSDLDEDTRRRLFDEIQAALDPCGGIIEKPRLIALFQARTIGQLD